MVFVATMGRAPAIPVSPRLITELHVQSVHQDTFSPQQVTAKVWSFFGHHGYEGTDTKQYVNWDALLAKMEQASVLRASRDFPKIQVTVRSVIHHKLSPPVEQSAPMVASAVDRRAHHVLPPAKRVLEEPPTTVLFVPLGCIVSMGLVLVWTRTVSARELT